MLGRDGAEEALDALVGDRGFGERGVGECDWASHQISPRRSDLVTASVRFVAPSRSKMWSQ